mmetsp:Transcript_18332/g.48378  ORF Transcript_18332/g.48378 Transcript_18332/m.48378 type:complete len:223 (+) Transcript_18332:82-750(+)|eukprot:CAMPEP_0119542684 /NCGR_PEP_ID=MMETSP1344-20130328/53724_1 /TAXON_ID=236787 /ORGANISM="Florenciella parvula, Strain CCMP2471" /LENGTH=222 /DNA_ID=CAMNT_0007586931 /DNA_START=23 /DNA_END=691 /DNA_ORIENTATION=-
MAAELTAPGTPSSASSGKGKRPAHHAIAAPSHNADTPVKKRMMRIKGGAADSNAGLSSPIVLITVPDDDNPGEQMAAGAIMPGVSTYKLQHNKDITEEVALFKTHYRWDWVNRNDYSTFHADGFATQEEMAFATEIGPNTFNLSAGQITEALPAITAYGAQHKRSGGGNLFSYAYFGGRQLQKIFDMEEAGADVTEMNNFKQNWSVLKVAITGVETLALTSA